MALVRVSSGLPRPEVAELLVVGARGASVQRFPPLPDPPDAADGDSWRGGFPVPVSALFGDGVSLRLLLDGQELEVAPPMDAEVAARDRELDELRAQMEARESDLADARAGL